MTCIVAHTKEGVLAADTRETLDDAGIVYCQKIFRATKGPNRGSLIGVAGGSFSSHVLLQWLLDPAHNRPPAELDFLDPDDQDGAYALILRPDRTIWLANGSAVAVPRHVPFMAVGSGAQAALGALHAGAKAAAAVRIACRIDQNCGLPVQVLRVS